MTDQTPPDSPTNSDHIGTVEATSATPSTTGEIQEPTQQTSSSRAPQAPKVSRVVRPDSSHRCPLHSTAADCKNKRIKPEDEEIYSELLDPIRITFAGTQESLRGMTYGKSNILPPALYRTFYELSATLSSRVSKDTHVRHRENENLILRDGNAFQTVGNPTFSEKVTKEGIERHLVWNKKKDPSAWISMFDELSHAKRRALFHYDESQRIGQRVTIAQISTADLIPATVHATCRSVWEIVIKDKHYGKRLLYSVTTRQVDVPIWVHSSVRPTTTSSISSEQLIASHADLFVCIKELRKSNLVQGPKTHSRRRTIAADGHNYEWLALGRILESRVTKVFPFDGKVFHMVKPSHTVRSTAAKENWIFDFDLETWRLESELDRSDAHKRKRDVGDDDDDHETTVDNSRERKKSRGHNLGFSAVIEVFAST